MDALMQSLPFDPAAMPGLLEPMLRSQHAKYWSWKSGCHGRHQVNVGAPLERGIRHQTATRCASASWARVLILLPSA